MQFSLLGYRDNRSEGRMSVGVDEEAREGTVFVVVSTVNFAPV